MKPKDPKTYLWSNVCALMGNPSPTIDQVASRVGIGRGSAQRIKEGVTSVGVDIMATIAEAFNIEVWQLLVPDLDKSHIPTLGEDDRVMDIPLSADVVQALSDPNNPMRTAADDVLRGLFKLPQPQGSTANDRKAA